MFSVTSYVTCPRFIAADPRPQTPRADNQGSDVCRMPVITLSIPEGRLITGTQVFKRCANGCPHSGRAHQLHLSTATRSSTRESLQMRTLALAAVGVVGACAALAAEPNWPQFRGPQGQGVSSDAS